MVFVAGWLAAWWVVWWVVSVEVVSWLPDDLLTLALLALLQYVFMLLLLVSAAHLYHTLILPSHYPFAALHWK